MTPALRDAMRAEAAEIQLTLAALRGELAKADPDEATVRRLQDRLRLEVEVFTV